MDLAKSLFQVTRTVRKQGQNQEYWSTNRHIYSSQWPYMCVRKLFKVGSKLLKQGIKLYSWGLTSLWLSRWNKKCNCQQKYYSWWLSGFLYTLGNIGADRSDGKDMITSDYAELSHCRGLPQCFGGKIGAINMGIMYHTTIRRIYSYNESVTYHEKLHSLLKVYFYVFLFNVINAKVFRDQVFKWNI